MYSNIVRNGPVFGGPYVPYFYQAGLYRFQPVSSGGTVLSPAGHAYARYDFAGNANPWAGVTPAQTVEQIIAHGYFAIPGGDPETALLSDRKHTSWLGLEDAIRQIRDRYRLYGRNIYDIELGKCAAISGLFTLEAERGSIPADSRELYGLSKLLQRFYQEQREERVSLWQDVARVRQTLPEVAQLYLSAYRKMEILEGKGGDVP